MAKTFKVQLGPKAYSFNDQSTGLSISRGEVKELTLRQFNTHRVRTALNQGHLSLVQEPSEAAKYSEEAIKKLLNKLEAQHAKGMEVSKVVKAYSLEEVQLMAKEAGFEVDPKDTAEVLIQSMFDDFEESGK